MELEEGKKFCSVSYIVLSLGTNDVSRARSNFAHKFQNDLAMLIRTVQKNYPQAKVSFFAVKYEMQYPFNPSCANWSKLILQCFRHCTSFVQSNLVN